MTPRTSQHEAFAARLAPVATDDIRSRLDDFELLRSVLGAISASIANTASSEEHIEDQVTDLLRRSAAVVGLRVITPQSELWPSRLLEGVQRPVMALWLRGDPDRLRLLDRAVAVVGARAATVKGMQLAEEIAAALVAAGRPVISGGAYGIDIAALRATIARGGVPVAVLAHDLSRSYPAAHAGDFAKIARQGLLLSEYPVHTTPSRQSLLDRNRITAALSQATVIVEAAAQSGSLATARRAERLGRPVLAVPTASSTSGTDLLAAEGSATAVRSADEMLAALEEATS